MKGHAKLAGFDDGVDVHVIRSSPRSRGTATARLFYAAGHRRSRAAWITTASLAPDDALLDVICEAAERGVDVRFLTNGPNVDKGVVRETRQHH